MSRTNAAECYRAQKQRGRDILHVLRQLMSVMDQQHRADDSDVNWVDIHTALNENLDRATMLVARGLGDSVSGKCRRAIWNHKQRRWEERATAEGSGGADGDLVLEQAWSESAKGWVTKIE